MNLSRRAPQIKGVKHPYRVSCLWNDGVRKTFGFAATKKEADDLVRFIKHEPSLAAPEIEVLQ